MRYGLFELPENQALKGTNMAEEVKEARIGKECPPQVLDLVSHLRETGTGNAKLERITELGKTTKDLNEFLSMLPNNIPAPTMNKVDEYLGKAVVEKEEKASGKKIKEGWLATEKGQNLLKRHKETKAKAEGKGETTVQTRSESQSSIPEHTVIQESKAPQLRAEGSNQSKQLGADVEVPTDSVPESGEEGSEGSGEASSKNEVADMNVGDAKDRISRMRSKPKLQAIVDSEERSSVKEAAEKRLNELEGDEGE